LPGPHAVTLAGTVAVKIDGPSLRTPQNAT